MVRFSISSELLARLRALRDKRQKERSPSQEGTPQPLGEIFAALGQDRSPLDLARQYCDGMNASQDQVEAQYDAFLIDPGMGPMTYLTADGRIIFDNRTWDDGDLTFATSLNEAAAALVVGARKTGIVELIDLIPSLPDALPCPKCQGKRWAKPFASFEHDIVCILCHGRGEATEARVAEAIEKGFV